MVCLPRTSRIAPFLHSYFSLKGRTTSSRVRSSTKTIETLKTFPVGVEICILAPTTRVLTRIHRNPANSSSMTTGLLVVWWTMMLRNYRRETPETHHHQEESVNWIYWGFVRTTRIVLLRFRAGTAGWAMNSPIIIAEEALAEAYEYTVWHSFLLFRARNIKTGWPQRDVVTSYYRIIILPTNTHTAD